MRHASQAPRADDPPTSAGQSMSTAGHEHEDVYLYEHAQQNLPRLLQNTRKRVLSDARQARRENKKEKLLLKRESNKHFHVKLLKGRWTKTHKGVSADVAAGLARGSVVAKMFLSQKRLQDWLDRWDSRDSDEAPAPPEHLFKPWVQYMSCVDDSIEGD